MFAPVDSTLPVSASAQQQGASVPTMQTPSLAVPPTLSTDSKVQEPALTALNIKSNEQEGLVGMTALGAYDILARKHCHEFIDSCVSNINKSLETNDQQVRKTICDINKEIQAFCKKLLMSLASGRTDTVSTIKLFMAEQERQAVTSAQNIQDQVNQRCQEKKLSQLHQMVDSVLNGYSTMGEFTCKMAVEDIKLEHKLHLIDIKYANERDKCDAEIELNRVKYAQAELIRELEILKIARARESKEGEEKR